MARQKLGQHFLRSGKVLDRIARAACGERVSLAVEIGSGRGALTEHLLNLADRVVAVELDPQLAEQLRQRWSGDPRLEIVQNDAAEIDLSQWGAGVLTGNLPYYAATHIVSRYVRRPGALISATFLIQQEVAARITASPGTRDYGFFSVECQLLSRPEYLFRVAPGAFRPPPKVDSAVVRLAPRASNPQLDIERFLAFVSVCFRRKRKTLRNNLTDLYPRERLDRYEVMSRRAEQLSIREFLSLYQAIAAAPEQSARAIKAALPGSGTGDETTSGEETSSNEETDEPG